MDERKKRPFNSGYKAHTKTDTAASAVTAHQEHQKKAPVKPSPATREPHNDVLIGRNAVTEALRNKRPIDTLYVGKGALRGSLAALAAKARDAGAVIKETDSRKLDSLSGGAAHQGVVALAAVKEYASLEDLFRLAEERGEAPFFLIADGLEDPHNLGAILRTAECAGAHGVILPSRRSVGLSWAVGKTSAGAVCAG